MYGYNCIQHEYFPMRKVAKKINKKGYGQNNLFRFLREKGILNSNNFPTEEYVKLGYFKGIHNTVALNRNYAFKASSCRVSKSGIEFIEKLIEEEQNSS